MEVRLQGHDVFCIADVPAAVRGSDVPGLQKGHRGRFVVQPHVERGDSDPLQPPQQRLLALQPADHRREHLHQRLRPDQNRPCPGQLGGGGGGFNRLFPPVSHIHVRLAEN